MERISIETMVMQVQNGDETIIPALWGRLERLFYRIVKKYMKERIIPVWAEQDDFLQSSYFAFWKAIQQYRPEKGYSFTSYLNYHVLNIINDQLGTRNGKKQIIPISGDAPISEDNESTILNQIPDENAARALESVEETCFQEELHQALEECLSTLPDEQERAIRAKYYQGLTLREIADQTGDSVEQVRRTIEKGLNGLRKPICRRKLEAFRAEIHTPYHVGLSAFQTTWTSQPERAVEWMGLF